MKSARPLATAVALAGVLAASACSTGGSDSSSSSSSAPSSSSSSSSSSATSSGSSSPTAASELPANVKVYPVRITGKTVTPAPSNVDLPLGHTLRLVVTSDHNDQIHVHGVDIEKDLKAGQPLTIEIKPTQSGVYEVETHHPPLTLMHIVVR
jgi:exo-beta-1,3-glucanase (GH17 family)